jgi:uncharacterized membrane protein YgdD (TMEM256/DUF423 family)
MRIIRIALILLAMGVVAGAFGAHGLEKVIDERSLKVWNTGVNYLFIHALGLMAIQLIHAHQFISSKSAMWSSRLLLVGILFFSGSLFLLSTQAATGINFRWLGPITPIGGLAFITGWITAAAGLKPSLKAEV